MSSNYFAAIELINQKIEGLLLYEKDLLRQAKDLIGEPDSQEYFVRSVEELRELQKNIATLMHLKDSWQKELENETHG